VIDYEKALGIFRSPRNKKLIFRFRLETNDWNTLTASTTEDEYRLADLPELTGVAIDVGGYLGSVAIALARDNPGLRVICIEPIPENVVMINYNVEANDLQDRIDVLSASAAAAPGIETINYRYRGSKLEEHHAFVGNIGLANYDLPHEEVVAPCVTLEGLLKDIASVVLLKIDCEGCEWGFLSSPAVIKVERIIGEWHPMDGHVQTDVIDLLDKTHYVTFSGPVEGPGGFVAIRR